MRTLLVVGIGVALSYAFVFATSYWGKSKVTGALVFMGVWLIFCAWDYARGVKAGYSAIDELGIHLLLFIVPALCAWLVARLLR
jgi:hypothetical protein